MVTESKNNGEVHTIDSSNSSRTQRPKFVLKKSKTKLIKSLDRKSSLNRAEVARMLREICAEEGIEYPNK